MAHSLCLISYTVLERVNLPSKFESDRFCARLVDCLLWLCGDKKVEAVSGSTYRKIAERGEDVHLSLAESGAYGGAFTPRPYDPKE